MAMPRIRAGARAERTFDLAGVEVRAGEGTPPVIVGHAAVYNRWSEDLGGFKERVLPGAFTKTLLGGDVRALFNHDPNFLLGRTKSGTLTLPDEAKGLHFEAMPPDTQTIRDLVLEPLRRGDVDHCSFSFSVPTGGDVWREPKAIGGLYERDLVELRLYDVSPVTFPAYVSTDVAVRSLLATSGVDLGALTAFLVRAERGLPTSDADVELLTSSIEVLRAYLPSANGGEPSGANAGEASRSEGVVTRAALLRQLEHRLRTADVAMH
jgi:HK97 family phage prohead protease